MGLFLTFILILSALVVASLYAVRKILSPHVPVKGKTNIPGLTEGICWPIVGDALWFANINNMTGKRWAALRKPLDKMMHPKFMRNYNKVFATKAEALCRSVGRMQGTFNMKNLMEQCTMNITLETLLEISEAQQESSTLIIIHNMEKVVDRILLRIVTPIYKFDWIHNLSEDGRALRKQRNNLRPIFQEMIGRRYKYFEENGITPNDPHFEPQNYIDTSIQVGRQEKMADDDLTFSFLDLIVAGYDTSTIAMSSAILFLAMHPAYQEQVYQEQLDVMGDGLAAPSQEEVSRMNFLSMVINETLRLVAVPLIGRNLSARIEVDGYVMPEGASILFSLHHIHRDPKHWAKPDEFFPEHFLPENVAKRSKRAFMPFGSGSRSCAGKVFALLSMKVILSILIRRYRFTTDLKYEDVTYKFGLMVESMCGYPIEATQRSTLENNDKMKD